MSDNALTQMDWLLEAAENPQLGELARSVPERAHGPGRKREHPILVGLLYVLAAGGITGSHRSAARLLGSERTWRLLRLAARKTTDTDLPRRAPSRGQLETLRSHLLEHLERIQDSTRALAVQQALDARCFDPRSTPMKLRRSDTLVGDGKVVAAPILSKTAERWQEQGRPIDTGVYKQAGEDSSVYVTGSKFTLLGVRAHQASNARILLDVAYLPPGKGYGGEAGQAVSLIGGIQKLVNEHGGSVNALCYDGALRGKHINPLLKSGLTVLSPVNLTISGVSPLELITCSCGAEHRLVTKDGAIYETVVADNGEQHLFECPIKRLVKRRNLGATASHRWYLEIELDCGRTLMVRVDATEDDARTGYNRTERIRQHAPTSKTYQSCYGWREEAESWNNLIDRTLYGQRMIAHTWRKQLLVMVGFVLARNVLAAHALSREKLRPSA